MSRHLQLLTLGTLVAAGVASSAIAGHNQAQPSIRSSLDGKKVLPIRIHWIAHPSVPASQVKKIDFLIDGRLAWVEHKTPYFYADDGNWLVTTFLTPGLHVFRVRLLTSKGQSTSDTVTARVLPAPGPPSQLRGTWSRTATKEDLKKCKTNVQGGCPPTGRWQLTISPRGWGMRDPQGGGGLFDVEYLTAGRAQLRPTIEYPPYPNGNNGGWCSDTDPLATWTATVDITAKTMNLRPVHSDPCGDRAAILEGTWTRVS